MSKYSSIELCTRNSLGDREVELTYRNGWFRNLFNLPPIKRSFVSSEFIYWRHKETGLPVDPELWFEIEGALIEMQIHEIAIRAYTEKSE